MRVNNTLVQKHMTALFVADRLRELQQEIDDARPREREALLRRALGEALREMGAEYLIPFRFARKDNRPSHYICFVTKHPLGYTIMKSVMATRGIVDQDGVPKFEYLPPSAGAQMAFDVDRPLEKLPSDLRKQFSGQTLTMIEVSNQHNVGTPFIPKNYKDVSLDLESKGHIEIRPQPGRRRQEGKVGNDVLVSFL